MSRVRNGLLVILLIGAVAAACGGSDGDEPAASGEPVEIVITVDDDGVDAPQRPRIDVGSQVTLVFSATEPGDAHLHGYDLWATVGPDGENRIEFLADEPGIFLVELEQGFLYLTELVVE